MAHCRERHGRVVLHTFSALADARRLYEAFGFVQIGPESVYTGYGAPIVDQALAVSTCGVTVGKYPNWGEHIAQRLEKVWTGEMTPQQALDEAQAAVQDALK